MDFITIPLYDHQKTSINSMEELEKNKVIRKDSETTIETTLGILADLPGYGKTLSIIGLIGKTKFDTEDDSFFKEKREVSNYLTMVKVKKI